MIKKVEMFTIVCDNCGEDIGENQECCCWNDKSYARENAYYNDWLELGDKNYCPNCYHYDDDDNLIISKPNEKC